MEPPSLTPTRPKDLGAVVFKFLVEPQQEQQFRVAVDVGANLISGQLVENVFGDFGDEFWQDQDLQISILQCIIVSWKRFKFKTSNNFKNQF